MFYRNSDSMVASVTPAAQNENLHTYRGKGAGGVKADAPKPLKTVRHERIALRDLSQIGRPLPSVTKKGSSLKHTAGASNSKTVKKEANNKILTDEDMAKCQEWAKDGIERMHFSGNDMHKFEAYQQEERVKKKVDKAMCGLQAWTDTMYGREIPVEAVSSDTEDGLKLEYEPEVLPPFRTSSKSGYGDIEELLKLDDDFSNFDKQFELKLDEGYGIDTPYFR